MCSLIVKVGFQKFLDLKKQEKVTCYGSANWISTNIFTNFVHFGETFVCFKKHTECLYLFLG